MSITTDKLQNPVVSALVAALNAGDRAAFTALLAPGATMSDDGSDRDVQEWIEREIFSANGHIRVESESNGGLGLLAQFRNDAWGEMRTTWRFEVDGGLVTRFETGQA
ncbi:MAG TPA: nuclear transport factor 2 family protein [Actinocrinis sp.]|nr:nuclear transport factor 2 family protein [Actinocrinis sp.]